uniref:Uncharacterized protein n=1 Tax=Meloidogyne incognita TaxID=6306 RepID=A0A914KKA7_MELIC
MLEENTGGGAYVGGKLHNTDKAYSFREGNYTNTKLIFIVKKCFPVQIIIYVNDNFEQVVDFPRFYLYPHEWNRMHFIARFIELLEHPNDCTNELVGKDANCFVRNWLTANVIDAFNCTVPYLEDTKGISNNLPICEVKVLAENYYNAIQLVHSGAVHSQECVPGCSRWEYGVSLQQSPALQPFVQHEFNLEISFYDLQYEHVYTISVPGFMSQIGGQFGFFLGLSIITMIQIAIYALSAFFTLCVKIPRKLLQQVNVFLKGDYFAQNGTFNNVNLKQSSIDKTRKNIIKINTITGYDNKGANYEETSFGGEQIEQAVNNQRRLSEGVDSPDNICREETPRAASKERTKQLTKQRRVSSNITFSKDKNDNSTSGFTQY